jgi:hypothetical protein
MPDTDLKNYFTHEQPFGPVQAIKTKDPLIFESLFYKKNLLYEEMSHRPSLIVGRRGAGKTVFLRSVILNPTYSVIVELPPEQAFRDVVRTIEEMCTGVVFVEEIRNIWDVVLWSALFIEMLRSEKCHGLGGLEKLGQYTSGLGIEPRMGVYTVMRKVVEIIKERGGSHPMAMIADFVDQIAFNGVVFGEARDTCLSFLTDNNMCAIILLDSLDQFPIDSQTMGHALAGLLKAQAEFHPPGSPVEMRCCLPAELYHIFMHLSSNPNKDFHRKVLLHWHPAELLRLAAQRYAQYLKLYRPEAYESKFRYLDLNTRKGAVKFWNQILPPQIKNRLNGTENTIPYVLRHTQLLPRQLLIYCNEIGARNLTKTGDPLHFGADAVLDGIYEPEATICSEIFSAFKYAHPGAQEACEQCIPYLPRHFTDGEFHTAYNRHGKGIQGVYDYQDFKTLLQEIGAVGRVTKIADRFVEGIFEYTLPHRLITTSEDRLCLHPVFTEVFRAQKTEGDARPVYPFGCNIDTEEYRDVR